MQKGLFIYDNSGVIVTIVYGTTTVPAGVQGVVEDIRTNARPVRVNTTTHQVEWELYPDTEAEVSNLQDVVIELEARVSALEG